MQQQQQLQQGGVRTHAMGPEVRRYVLLAIVASLVIDGESIHAVVVCYVITLLIIVHAFAGSREDPEG